MADEKPGIDAGGFDKGLSDRPTADRGGNPAWGRTSADLAANQPPGHAESTAGFDTEDAALAGMDDVTGPLTGTKVDIDTGGDIRRGRPRELHPEVDPDTRLGLHPTIRAEDLPKPTAEDDAESHRPKSV